MERIDYDVSDAHDTEEQMQIIIETLEDHDLLRDDHLYSVIEGGKQTERLLETGTYRNKRGEEDIIFAFKRNEFVGEGPEGRSSHDMVINQATMYDRNTIVVWDANKLQEAGYTEYRFKDPSNKLDALVAVLEEI